MTLAWSPSAELNDASIATPTVSPTSSQTYTLTATMNGCSSSDDVEVTMYELPTASIAITDLSVSGTSDLTEAIEADAITWTNSGTGNGDIQYYYEGLIIRAGLRVVLGFLGPLIIRMFGMPISLEGTSIERYG